MHIQGKETINLTSATTMDRNLSATKDNSSATRENGSKRSWKQEKKTIIFKHVPYGYCATKTIDTIHQIETQLLFVFWSIVKFYFKWQVNLVNFKIFWHIYAVPRTEQLKVLRNNALNLSMQFQSILDHIKSVDYI